MKEITYYKMTDCVKVEIPLTSQGKFRCKNKKSLQDYGESFAPKTETITDKAYVEWQIGYDLMVGDNKKTTSLNQMTFTGANGSKKNPYELSEILYALKETGCVTNGEIGKLRNEIESKSTFLFNQFKINAKNLGSYNINNISLLKSEISLPTFIYKIENSEIYIEIQIKQQQYASGVQPMLYLCIPMKAFDNSGDIIGKTSAKTPNGILTLNAQNKDIILDVFKMFGLCSDRHKYDIVEILKLLEK